MFYIEVASVDGEIESRQIAEEILFVAAGRQQSRSGKDKQRRYEIQSMVLKAYVRERRIITRSASLPSLPIRSSTVAGPRLLSSSESDREESRNASKPCPMGFALIIAERGDSVMVTMHDARSAYIDDADDGGRAGNYRPCEQTMMRLETVRIE